MSYCISLSPLLTLVKCCFKQVSYLHVKYDLESSVLWTSLYYISCTEAVELLVIPIFVLRNQRNANPDYFFNTH